jgi:hypothetical protein
MAQTKPTPVRLSIELIDRLDRAAKTAHLSNRTEVIKLCISSFLDYFEQHGVAALPLNWEEMLRDMDGRTRKDTASSHGLYLSNDDQDLKVAESGDGYLGKSKKEKKP